ncbi:MAG TPA: ABC transporter permease [Kofleriaceae bacterium]
MDEAKGARVTAFVLRVIAASITLVLAGLGGSVTERSGVVDLAIEGKLLFGAFAAAVVGHATGSLAAAIAAGMLAGMLVAAVQVGCAVGLGADQVIVGIGLNLIALAGTRFLMQVIYDTGTNTPPCPQLSDNVFANPLAWIAVGAAIAVPLALHRTRWGLRLRAAGDRPDALRAVGVSPVRTRLYAGLVGGALSGAGGAKLSLAVAGFSADMAGGRGYIALAMVILAGWRPAVAALACLGLAIADALEIHIEITTAIGRHIPTELAHLVPYVLTLVVLVVWSSKARQPPAALGRPE